MISKANSSKKRLVAQLTGELVEALRTMSGKKLLIKCKVKSINLLTGKPCHALSSRDAPTQIAF